MKLAPALLMVVLAGLPLSAAWGLDFKSVGGEPAILFDAPTQRGQKLFVAPRGMPLEVVLTQGDWLRVRDAAGDFAWVEKKALSDRRTLVTIVAATVRSRPDAAAEPVFRVARGVLLALQAPSAGGWVHVRHADGASGYLNATEVWGE